MEQGFMEILQQMIKERGKDVILDASKCKSLLADYTKGEYKKESKFLLKALEAKVQKAVNSTQEIEVCRKQQIRLLNEEEGIDEKIAIDLVDTLFFILRGVEKKGSGEATTSSGTSSPKQQQQAVETKQMELGEVCTKSYGMYTIKDGEEVVNNQIFKNSAKPAHREIIAKPFMKNQPSMEFRIFENNSIEEDVPIEKCVELYEACIIELTPGLSVNDQIKINFDVNKAGLFTVSAVDLTNNLPLPVNVKIYGT